MNNDLAPILVCVYDRIDHFKQCIESLKQCELAGESDIFIMSDGPARWEDVRKVKEVREYVNTISGFKSVNKIFRRNNWGVPDAIKDAFRTILRRYKKIIFMEDDIVVSPNFLEYMNKSLDFYRDDKRIYSISGYCPPIDIPEDYERDIFLTHRFNPWGYGTWWDRIENIDISYISINRQLKKKNDFKKYKKIGNDVFVSLLTWPRDYYPGDYSICLQMVEKGLYSVTPVVSKTNNIGNDGSGVHCRVDRNFRNPVLDEGYGCGAMVKDIVEDKLLNDLLRKYYTSFVYELKFILHRLNLLKYIPDSIYGYLSGIIKRC